MNPLIDASVTIVDDNISFKSSEAVSVQFDIAQFPTATDNDNDNDNSNNGDTTADEDANIFILNFADWERVRQMDR